MNFLTKERRVLEQFLPGLDQQLANANFMELEQRGSPAIQYFREAGGAKMLIPKVHLGFGMTPLESIQVHRAIAARSPSLAIAATMHNFSIATLVDTVFGAENLDSLILEAIATQNLLVASGFSEGRSTQSILAPTMTGVKEEKGYRINGVKKPCTLAHSMDLLTVSISIPADGSVAVALIPAKAVGLERKPFWKNPILAGAESDEVILKDVFVENELIYPLKKGDIVESTQLTGYIWFELLVTASYLGVASALAEKAFIRNKGSESDLLNLGIRLEAAMASLEAVAIQVDQGPIDYDLLARVLLVRYACQESITASTNLAVDLLGGMAFISSEEVSYLYAAARALAFHPPSRTSTCTALLNYLRGEELIMV